MPPMDKTTTAAIRKVKRIIDLLPKGRAIPNATPHVTQGQPSLANVTIEVRVASCAVLKSRRLGIDFAGQGIWGWTAGCSTKQRRSEILDARSSGGGLGIGANPRRRQGAGDRAGRQALPPCHAFCRLGAS